MECGKSYTFSVCVVTNMWALHTCLRMSVLFASKMEDFCANCKQTTVSKNHRVLKDHCVGVYYKYLVVEEVGFEEEEAESLTTYECNAVHR